MTLKDDWNFLYLPGRGLGWRVEQVSLIKSFVGINSDRFAWIRQWHLSLCWKRMRAWAVILVALTGGGLTTVVATAVVTIPSTIHSTVPGTSALLGYSHFTDGTTEAQSRYPGSHRGIHDTVRIRARVWPDSNTWRSQQPNTAESNPTVQFPTYSPNLPPGGSVSAAVVLYFKWVMNPLSI